MRKLLLINIILLFFLVFSCKNEKSKKKESKEQLTTLANKNPFVWEGANIYFLLTDRFFNGDKNNDNAIKRTKKTGTLRGFEGGDIKGIIKKIEEGYFTNLGINAIWMTPIVEQIHGSIDEGTGNTYAYHGYWTKDWTNIDPSFGSKQDLKQLIETAHKNGIRILMDVVLNHTGPMTHEDPVWSDSWVRTFPKCTYQNYQTAVSCTLVDNLPDIKTENNQNIELPKPLIDKWKKEGKFESEISELDEFFTFTGLKRSPKNYIIKWLTDYVREFGIDGFRVDTVKHVEEDVWNILSTQAKLAFKEWKTKNPDKVLDENEFYIIGELYGYGIDTNRNYHFKDRKVDYFANGFDNLINFQFKYDADQTDYEYLFNKYSTILNTKLKGKSVMNYISSHDDMEPFDNNRSKTYVSATKLLLSPGISQIYYGDELARPLIIKNTQGDATLRSFMNWNDLDNENTKKLLKHWQKLGKFRKEHPAIGAGKHNMISKSPYVFSRIYDRPNVHDKVVIGLDLPTGVKKIKVNTLFSEGTKLVDKYSNTETIVHNNTVSIDSDFSIVLLEQKEN